MIEVTVACALAPREVFEQVIQVKAVASVRDAVEASTLRALHPGLDWDSLNVGVWGRAAAWEQVLQAGDRIELCRPLLVDPKVARRERFQQQGARGTGLFARQRKDGKAGY
ncbi:MAG: RnfH family protein [Variovorax sp.]|nr:MAG: RnfH family protein [Variovorax sp.]